MLSSLVFPRASTNNLHDECWGSCGIPTESAEKTDAVILMVTNERSIYT